jgi:ferrochelatase
MAQDKSPLPQAHPKVNFGKIGVLLVNLGTPDGHDEVSMRRYLKQFLSDKRVIELPTWKWWPILNLIVLRTRPKKSGEAYATIWNNELDEGPLRTYTRSQAELLAKRMGKHDNLLVDYAMRYGQPSIKDKLEALKDQGCERIVIYPLYPQYAASTTATVNDDAFDALKQMRWMPAIRTVPAYHDDPVYIDALAKSIEEHIAGLDYEPERVIASYHGIPQRYFDNGDPYHCHCHKTTRLLEERLGWEKGRLMTCFQSLFGKEEWIKPYTDKTLEALPSQGIKNIAIFNPGFVCDCLETLEEIAIEGKETFLEHGGENYSHIPCLNDDPYGMDVIEHVVRRELSGWLD